MGFVQACFPKIRRPRPVPRAGVLRHSRRLFQTPPYLLHPWSRALRPALLKKTSLHKNNHFSAPMLGPGRTTSRAACRRSGRIRVRHSLPIMKCRRMCSTTPKISLPGRALRSQRTGMFECRGKRDAASSRPVQPGAKNRQNRYFYKPRTVLYNPPSHGRVAQLVEHATENRSVGSSILPPATIFLPHRYQTVI